MTLQHSGDFVIEARRCVDDLIYRFQPAGFQNGRPCWQRVDLPLHLHWSRSSGWVISDQQGFVLARPWEVEKEDQGAVPPHGIWVSRKGPKSYVYDLRFIAS